MPDIDVSTGRSPRYPRFPLLTAVMYARRLYDGAHRSTVDTITAYRVMGFAGKSGASATALGAARQFGLVESTKGGVRISDLGLKVLQPSSDGELNNALYDASLQPQVFRQIVDHFGQLPKSDEPIRSFLIRTLDFSKSGADDCIASLRETISELPTESPPESIDRNDDGNFGVAEEESVEAVSSPTMASASSSISSASVMRFPLTKECEAELRFSGPLSAVALDRLVKHVELLKDVWSTDT